jgi:hypothetical protein
MQAFLENWRLGLMTFGHTVLKHRMSNHGVRM